MFSAVIDLFAIKYHNKIVRGGGNKKTHDSYRKAGILVVGNRSKI